MSDTDSEFRAITGDIMSEEANDLLDKHIARSRKWLAEKRAAGEPTDLWDFIKKLHGEPNLKGPIVAAYAAALWRLLEVDHA